MPTITLTEPLQINAIVWIGSLPSDEQGPSRRMLDELTDEQAAGGFPVFEYMVQDRQELFAALDQIADEASRGLRPVLHFDTHGNPAEGIYLDPTGEWASWPELMDRLRAINVATANNLVVVFALCFGLHLYKLAELSKPAPAYLFAAAEKTVKVGFLLDEVPAFYKGVQASGGFLEPFNATLGKEMNLINCQGLFLQALAQYVRQYASGEALERRVEKLVAAILERDGISDPTDEQLAEIDAKVRSGLAPGEKLIEMYAPRFLIGRGPAFTYEEVEKVAGQRRDPGLANG